MEYNHYWIQLHWNTTSIEDNLNWRRPQYKITSMEDNIIGRQPQWKTTSMEDNLNERRPEWKTKSMEDDLNGRQTQWRTTSRKPYRKQMTSACLVTNYVLSFVQLSPSFSHFFLEKPCGQSWFATIIFPSDNKNENNFCMQDKNQRKKCICKAQFCP